MIRVTTPKQVFTFEMDPSDFVRVLITYAQGDRIVLEKEKSDLHIESVENAFGKTVGYAAWFRMTQEEANRFIAGPGKQVSVQVRVKTVSGEVLASDKKTFSVQDVLNDEVL